MELREKSRFLEKSMETLSGIYDGVKELPVLDIKKLDPGKTALIVIDMINGFAREGALKSPYVEKIIPDAESLMKLCASHGIPAVLFADCHSDASPEFDSYPPHCMAGTNESEVVEELKHAGAFSLIRKNSTNGFLEGAFRKWLEGNRPIDCFVIAGDCTDICIQQFAVTLKTWFNRQDKKSRVIVPLNAVDTYDLGLHDRDLFNLVALQFMIGNGIEVVGRVV